MNMRFLLFIFISLILPQIAQGKDKKPKIIGQKELTTMQGQPITIRLSDLIVQETEDKNDNDDDDDEDGRTGKTYPEGYTLEIFGGKDYLASRSTVTPDQNFKGVLTVPIRVKNEKHSSKKYDLKITVKPQPPQNKPPVITGQSALTTPKDTPVKIKFSDLFVSDSDNNYPDGFSLHFSSGENYTVNDNTVTPKGGFTGILTVPVRVNDGKNFSEPFNLKITVIAVITNVAPEITAQVPLIISVNETLKILFSHLTVIDPDNNYPSDFTLKIFPGDNYTVSDFNIQPKQDFAGDLFVKIAVHDGIAESKIYNLKITVKSIVLNTKPIITGQVGLKVIEGQNMEIKLSYLVVSDPDNLYPEDFSMTILPGINYTILNQGITPVEGYTGTLKVKITVNDGKISSDPFELKIEVIPQSKMEIIGQKSLETWEDLPISIGFPDLIVNDPTNTFPVGFDIQILKGENYEGNNGSITPQKNFNGSLTVQISISKGGTISSPFSLLIIVKPVNDSPELLNLEADPLVATGTGPWVLAPNIEVNDVDDDHLLFVEMGFTSNYQNLIDEFIFDRTENIHGVFDPDAGLLFLLGRAPLEEYNNIIRSVKYNFKKNNRDTFQIRESKSIFFRLNDGKDSSQTYKRTVILDGNLTLDIPTAFTPNNDQANDTWKIIPLKKVEQLTTFIRVYNKEGILVFETKGLENEWDGQFKGVPLPADVYFYTIELDLTYSKVNYKGIVALLR